MKILIIEDSEAVVSSLKLCFKVRWPDAQVVSTNLGKTGVDMVESESPDIVILDLGLPDIDGSAVLKQIRNFSEVPVIVLTVRSGEMDSVSCLEEGADDYVTKPFSALELLARIRTVLRRKQWLTAYTSSPPFVSGFIRVEFDSRQVFVNGKQVRLTPTEYGLLNYLISNRNRVVSHEAILAELWGGNYDDPATVKTFISQVRRKFDDAGVDSTRLISSIRGFGYKFNSPV